ncbi:uncharacterized protein K444DRAFT_322760 [Hyaloscypha bicolor E]|uniref:Uncharacterized protein n=1 Tax=Hyaloscypha bicolor E TaxID=1095630 RepID=A0A2J6TKK9_9HELO|nr:uncharacterized protein K444DRAFT_322760 [Hyaloscypha bicolor E]PMD63536.1 hypothetical protein K444DRAFT_322760 [Hyaloscypha bicolor E]
MSVSSNIFVTPGSPRLAFVIIIFVSSHLSVLFFATILRKRTFSKFSIRKSRQ